MMQRRRTERFKAPFVGMRDKWQPRMFQHLARPCQSERFRRKRERLVSDDTSFRGEAIEDAAPERCVEVSLMLGGDRAQDAVAELMGPAGGIPERAGNRPREIHLAGRRRPKLRKNSETRCM